jgi:hypothetical protein
MKALPSALTIGLALASLCALSGCSSSSTRMKRHFDMSSAGTPSEAEVRDAMLAKVPIGSSKSEVIGFLTDSGLTTEWQERGQSYSVHEDLVRCWFRSNGTLLIRSTKYGYLIDFRFENDRLFAVEVAYHPEFP